MGKAILMGAGLGGRDLLTVRGLEMLQQADVVLVDALVDPQLLAEVSPRSQVTLVGKRAGQEQITQEQINEQLVQFCRQESGLILRLKTGDPLIFGRAAEEVRALQAAGCPFEIVPGLSAALTGPLLAGIPLTDKEMGRCFGVMTGHDLEQIPWEAVAQLDTVVILMGGRQLAAIAQRLIQVGRAPETPMAVISRAGQASQQTWTGSLGDLAGQLSEESLSPAVIVIGAVVGLQDLFLSDQSWLPDPKPLAGRTVLVTRADTQASAFTDLLKVQGARVIEMPTLAILPPRDWQSLDEAIQNLQGFSWLILTSANAVDCFFARLTHHHLDSRALSGIQIAVVGSKTAKVLSRYGLIPDLIPQDFIADRLLTELPDLRGRQILFPRVESGGRDVLVKGLRSSGAEVIEVSAYQSTCPTQTDPTVIQQIQSGAIDILTFASSKTVQHFCQLIRQAGLDPAIVAQSMQIAAIGPKTADTCRAELSRVDIMPNQYTLEDLVQAIVNHQIRGTNSCQS